MSTIKPFDFNGQQVRTVTIEGEPWFVLSDLCSVLGLTTPARVLERLDDGVSLAHPIQDRMSANIRTPSQHCADECSRAFMHGPYDYGPGVVRRCEHGRIWKYLSNKASISLWGRVRFQLEPIVYIRAVVALKDIGNGVTSGTHN